MKPLKERMELPHLLDESMLRPFVGASAVILLSVLVVTFMTNAWLGLALVFLIALMGYLIYRFSSQYAKRLNDYVLNLSYRIKRGEQEAIVKMPIGILMYNDRAEIEWINPYLQSQIKKAVLGEAVKTVQPEIGKQLAAVIQEEKEEGHTPDERLFVIEWFDKVYQVQIQPEVESIYLHDMTEQVEVENNYLSSRPVFGWLFLDNYDELIKGLDDRGVSAFDSMLTTYLSNWATQHNVYYKRQTNDRYLLLLQYKELERLEAEKFNVIENIRQHSSKRNLPLTISIGMAYGEATFKTLDDIAQKNVDLALSRGGDQAIVRAVGGDPVFYGGQTNPMEKRTRVRARMISESLQELIRQSPTTYVMGHKFPDMDAIGSSFGVARIAKMLGKNCRVVVDNKHIGEDVQKLIEEVKKYPETYNSIISPEAAMRAITANDLIVLVDHHQPGMAIAPQLFEKSKRFVVIDHHRLGVEFENEPLFAYVEPYASSASELITEFFEHVPATETGGINRIEATAMLGGIIVDTNGFSLRTGSRTFDAASYLQSVGANTTLIQRLLKQSPEQYLERSALIERMKFVKEGIAVVTATPEKTHTQVMAAQTADTILGMEGVEAAFVIVRLADHRIAISARSLGAINVQRVMEKMGGGGHLSNAATQIEGKTLIEVRDELEDILEEF